MIELAPFLVALFVAAVVKHVAARVFFHTVYPVVRLHKQRGDRAQERADALDPGLSQQRKAELTIQFQKEEGVSFRPLAKLVVGHLAIWLIALVGSWIASITLGGVLAEPVWWVYVVFECFALLIAIPAVREKQGASWSVAGCSIAGIVLLLLPLTVMYCLAPLGIMVFMMMYWVVARLGWRLFPYNKGDFPKVAMLFV